jgi:predicted dehydrogenase
MKKLRCAIIGTGFWANYQIPAWLELEGVEIVALLDKDKRKAEAINEKFKLNATVYDDYKALLKNEKLDFVDIITDVDTHALFTTLAAAKGVDVICQKPMGASFRETQRMVEACKDANVQFFIHENFRWQAPIRALKKAMDTGVIGKPFKAIIAEEIIKPKLYNWLDPDYAVVHSSIVDCNADILKGLQGGVCETMGADNFKTVELVWKSYESAEKNGKIDLT